MKGSDVGFLSEKACSGDIEIEPRLNWEREYILGVLTVLCQLS